MKKQGKLVITKIDNYIFSLLYDNNNDIMQINVDGNEESILGNVYVGRVSNIVKNINAAFIEFQNGLTGYYSLDTFDNPIFINPDRAPGPLRQGDLVLVQVIKEASGQKDPVLTTNINFVGKYVVFSLKQPGVHFSNKLKWPELIEAISNRYSKLNYFDFGFIIRTNAYHAEVDDIFEEIELFVKLWLVIKDLAFQNKNLSLLYKAPKSYISSIRDGYHNEVGQIITDNKLIYDEIRSYLEAYQFADLNKLKFYDNSVTSLQTLYNVRKNISDALCNRVWLKSGGYIVIEPTEALTSIDVNSGKYVSQKDSQKEFLKINLEAAKEIAHQIRLRNLTGIIIIDFINMKNKDYQTQLIKSLEEFLLEDPIKTSLVDMTKLNLVEITRKKGRLPLHQIVVKNFLQNL